MGVVEQTIHGESAAVESVGSVMIPANPTVRGRDH